MSKPDDTVFLALFNSCIYESAPETISVHRTRAGADAALVAHQKKHRKDNKRGPKTWEVWCIEERKVVP